MKLILFPCLFVCTFIFAQCPGTALTFNSGCSTTRNITCGSWTAPGGGVVNPTCGTPANGEAWLNFTTTATFGGHSIKIEKTTAGGTNPVTNPSFQLYSGACGALTLVGCYNNDSGSGNDEYEFFGALSPSTSYYIRVYDADGTSVCSGGGRNYQFLACVKEFERNDDCNTATSLAVTATCGYNTIDNTGFIRSDQPAATCANMTATTEDMWYTFVAPASGEFAADLIPGGITDSGMEIYSGTCNALTSISCNDDKGINGTYPNALMSRIITSLTPGNTYYLRLWGYGGGTGTMDLCLRDNADPSNDNCGSPESLVLGVSEQSTNWSSSVTLAEDPPTTACNGSVDGNVWYTFTTTTAGDYYIDLLPLECSQGKGLQVDVGSFSGVSCLTANWTSEICSNPGNCNDINLTATALAAATTYYIFVDGWGAMLEFAEYNIVVNNSATLPSEISDFNAVLENEEVRLSWISDVDVQTKQYLIQRSTDGTNFIDLMTIEPRRASGAQFYQIYDKDVLENPEYVYYRIVHYDLNDKKQYYKYVAVKVPRENEVSLYPNPATVNVNLEIAEQDMRSVEINLYDALGNRIMESNYLVQREYVKIGIETSRLQRGLYFIEIYNGNDRSVEKLILK